MNKIWLCGQISSTATEYIDNLKRQAAFFDGFIWTVNFNTTITSQTLQESRVFNELQSILNYKKGEIIPARWINFHDIGMNLFLQSGHIKNGDWILWIDCQETLLDQTLTNLRSFVETLEKNAITAVFWGRPYLFKFNDQMTFSGNPHCWPAPLTQGNFLNIQDETKVKYVDSGVYFGDFLFNGKKFEDSYILHAFKYMHTYNVSNEVVNQHGKEEAYKRNEERLKFRNYCLNNLLLKDLNVDTFEQFLKEKHLSLPEYVINYIESEKVYKDFFRLKILKEPLQQILADNKAWSFKTWLANY